jgi:hypothetical protein
VVVAVCRFPRPRRAPRRVKTTKPRQGDPGRVLEILGSEKRLVARSGVTRASRHDPCYYCCYRCHDTYCGTTRRSTRRTATGTRGCATRLCHCIARDHRKENHRCQLFHAPPKRTTKVEFDGAH